MAIEQSPLAAAISAHWDALQRQCVEIPEWGEPGQPAKVYFDPLTLAERDKLRAYPHNEFIAQAIILKAEDAAGKKLFSIADKHQLLNAAAPSVITRIAERILIADCIDIEKLGEL